MPARYNPLWESSDEPQVYRTTTQDMLEQRESSLRPSKAVRQVNFTSYQMKPLLTEFEESIKISNTDMISTYTRDYEVIFERKQPPQPKTLFYGRPYNLFEYRPTVNSKFMDDMLVFPSPNRLRLDCERQSRIKSHVFDANVPGDDPHPCHKCELTERPIDPCEKPAKVEADVGAEVEAKVGAEVEADDTAEEMEEKGLIRSRQCV